MFDLNRHSASADAFRLLVSAYHPDTLRYPSSPVSERLRHALTWNVFKTLEQIAPSAWMRPLVARCAGLPDDYDSAPHITAVTCWSNLEPAPSAMLRRGRRHGVPVNAIIDTDDTVITVLAPAPSELLDRVLSESAEDGLLDVAEATANLAGTRSAYVTVVLPAEVDEQVWAPRVRQRAERVMRGIAAGGRSQRNLRGIGVTTWNSMHELLADVLAAPFLSKSERRMAATTRQWIGERLAQEVERKRLA